MNQHVVNRTFFKKFAAIALSLLFGQSTFAQSTQNQEMVFEGSLADATGNAISLSGQTLVFYISVNGCYLYGESSTTAGDGLGNIVHRFGSGTIAPGSPNSFSQNLFFGNVTGTTAFAGNNCSATASDTRLAQVYYAAQNITATMKLGTVPYAQNATMLSGRTASEFVLVSADTNTLLFGGSTGQFLTKSASGLTWTSSSLSASQITSALGYTPASTQPLTAVSVTSALGYAPVSSSALNNYILKLNNLSDLPSSATARTNLGLGTLATKNSVNLGTSDVTGSLQVSSLPGFTGDVNIGAGSSTTTVQALRGILLSATAPVSGQVLYYNGSAWVPLTIPSGVGSVTSVNSTNSDIIVTSSTTTPNLTLNAGTGSFQVIRLDASAKLPAVNASQLTALNADQITSGTLSSARLPAFFGDATTPAGSNTITVSKLRGIAISSATPTTNQVLAFNAGQWIPTTFNTGTITNITAGTGLLGGSITSAGTISVNFGITSGTVAAGNDSRFAQALQAVNNLSDVTSVGAARSNLGLGALSTKSSVNLGTSDVTGVLPISNGGSPWLVHTNGYYTASNTAIGSSTVLANTKLLVESNSPSQVARFINNAGNGYGVRIDVAGSSSAQYALNVNNASGSILMAQNDGNVGVGTLNPLAKLDVRSNSDNVNSAILISAGLSGASSATARLGLMEFGTGNFDYGFNIDYEHNSNQLAITGVSSGVATHRFAIDRLTGNVGIGTPTSSTAKLHVAGAVVSKPFIIGSGTAVDLALSNMFILNSVGGSGNSAVNINLSNMTDGGTYTLIITDPLAHTYNFTGCTTTLYSPANSLTVPGTRSIFGLITVKNGANWDCYINWTPGYQ